MTNRSNLVFKVDMKKSFFVLICFIISAAVVAGCSSAAPSPFNRSGFLEQKNVRYVAPVYETCSYNVTFVKNEKSVHNVDFNLDKNSYLKTELSVYESDGAIGEAGKSYYLFTTEVSLAGDCNLNGETKPFNTGVLTKVYFDGMGADLKPVYSERTAKTFALEGKSSDLKLVDHDYFYAVKYEGDDAKVTLTANDSENVYSAAGTYALEKVSDGNYIDNELLLFAPRAMTLTSLSTSFKTVDALSKTAQTISLTLAKEETVEFAANSSVRSSPAGSEVFSEYRTACNVATLKLEIASDYPGAAQSLSFAAESEPHEYQRLIKAEYPATYGVGTFVFTIKDSYISFN